MLGVLHPNIKYARNEQHFFGTDENFRNGLKYYKHNLPLKTSETVHSVRGHLRDDKYRISHVCRASDRRSALLPKTLFTGAVQWMYHNNKWFSVVTYQCHWWLNEEGCQPETGGKIRKLGNGFKVFEIAEEEPATALSSDVWLGVSKEIFLTNTAWQTCG